MTSDTEDNRGTQAEGSSKDPAWAEQMVAYIEGTRKLTYLSYGSFHEMTHSPRLVRALNNGDSARSEVEKAERLRHAEEQASTAQEMIDSDFQLLHAHAIMGVWGALEAAIEDCAVQRIADHPELLSTRPFEKMQLPVALLGAGPNAQARHVVSVLQRELNADRSLGVGQFERLLGAVGLGGAVPPSIRRALLFAQQFRHLVAHRGGRADERFRTACPDERWAVDELVRVDQPRFQALIDAIAGYFVILLTRLRIINDGVDSLTGAQTMASESAYWEKRAAVSFSTSTQDTSPTQ